MRTLFDVVCYNKECKEYDKEREIFTKDVGSYLCPSCGSPTFLYYTKAPSFELKGNGWYKSGKF